MCLYTINMENRGFKLGAFDVDGTLMEKGLEHPREDVVEVLKKLPNLTFVTTRTINQLESAISDSSLSGFPVAVLGGSEIWSLRGEVISSHLLSQDHKLNLAMEMSDQVSGLRTARYLVAGKREMFVYADTPELAERYANLFSEMGTKVDTTHDYKLFEAKFLATDTTSLSLRVHEGRFTLDEDKGRILNVDRESKNNAYIFYTPGTNKGSALVELCALLGVTPNEVLSAGDTEGVDTDMFAHSYGIAVGKMLSGAKEVVDDPETLRRRLLEIFG